MDRTKVLILQRIQEIEEHSAGMDMRDAGFSKRDGRWRQLEVEGVHISEVDFSALDTEQLIYIFEHIIRRYYTCM